MIRAALRSLLARKVRLLMSTFAIVLGVAFVVGTLIFSDTLQRSFTALFDSTVGDVVVQPDGGQTGTGNYTTKTIPASLVAELAALPGAARADGNVTSTGVYVLDSNNKPIGSFGPPALGGNVTDAPPASGGAGLAITEGRAPSGPNEVALLDATAEDGGYEVGDQVSILLPAGAVAITPTLVGIIGFPEGGSLNGATFVGFDTATAQDLFLDGDNAFNDVWVTARDGVSQDELAAQANEMLPDDIHAVTGDDAAQDAADGLLEAISFITIFLLVFALIALVVGAFLIVNTFSMLVAQRTRELALLRAMGASRRQVLWSVQVEAFVLGVVGSTLGIGLGVLLAIGLRALFGAFGLDLAGQSLIYAPRTFIVAYAVGIVITMVAAAFPARRTTKIVPVQALRDDVALPESSMRRRFWLGLAVAVLGGAMVALTLAEVAGVWLLGVGGFAILLGVAAMSPVISRPFLKGVAAVYRRLFGWAGNLAAENTLRNPRRTTATASALMIALAVASTFAMFGSSIKATVDQAVEENFIGDYFVNSNFGGAFNTGVADEIEKVPGVTNVVRLRVQILEDDGFRSATAVDPTDIGVYGLTTVAGNLDDLADNTVLLSKSFAEENNLAVGDTYEAHPAGETTYDWKVVGIFDDNPVMSSRIVTTINTFNDVGFRPEDNLLVVFTDDSPGVRERLDEIVADVPIITVKDQREFAADQRAQVDPILGMIYALLGLAMFIAFLGVVNTLALSVVERTREVGLLRAIGMGRAHTWLMITLESVVISLLGALLGVILGIGFGFAILVGLGDDGPDVISLPVNQIVVFLVVAVVAGVLAAVLPAWRASRLNVLDAIATE